MTREPTLADRVLAITPKQMRTHGMGYVAELAPRLQDKLIEAKRFVFDAKASRYVGEMIREVPEAIAHGQEFALAPFDNCWIEYGARELWEAVNYPQLSDSTADTLVGFQILWPSVYVWAHAPIKNKPDRPGLSPFKYKMFQPMTMNQEIRFCEQVQTSRIQLDTFFWGESIKKIAGRDDLPKRMLVDDLVSLLDSHEKVKVLRSLREHHSVEMLGDEKAHAKVWSLTAEGSGADLRNIVAVLLFLNRTSKIQVVREVPPKQGWIHNKSRTLVRHNVVQIKLNPLPQLIRLGGYSGVWRRAHEVRGHFCLNKRARFFEMANPSHLHDWVERDIQQWGCLGCGGMKWWRKAHRRGHEEKGKAQTEYAVTE